MPDQAVRDSKVWNLSLTDDQRKCLSELADRQETTLRGLVDRAIDWELERRTALKAAIFRLPRRGARRAPVRVDAEKLGQLVSLFAAKYGETGGPVFNAASILTTVIWQYVEAHGEIPALGPEVSLPAAA